MYAGELLNGHYILIKNIGNGQFSEVWLSIDYAISEYVAIKIFSVDNYDMGLNEIEILEKITRKKCEYCISYIEQFDHNGMICIVQQLMAGSLYSIMKYQYQNGFSLETVGKIAIQLLRALDFVHTELKIIHTDIKPENILVVGHSIDVDNIINRLNVSKNATKNKKNMIKLINKIKQLFCKNIDLVGSDKMSLSNIGESESGESSQSCNDEILTDSDIASSHSSHISRSYFDSPENTDNEIQQYTRIVCDECINDPHIVLADFGNCIEFTDNIIKYSDVQTRHYRSPEIILRLQLNDKIDIWAVGCTIYELLTNRLLFDPHKTSEYTTDLRQIYDFYCIFGIFPESYYTGRKNMIFFKNDFILKKFNKIIPCDLNVLMEKNIKHDLNENIYDKICDLIKKCLIYDIKKRPSAHEILCDYDFC